VPLLIVIALSGGNLVGRAIGHLINRKPGEASLNRRLKIERCVSILLMFIRRRRGFFFAAGSRKRLSIIATGFAYWRFFPRSTGFSGLTARRHGKIILQQINSG